MHAISRTPAGWLLVVLLAAGWVAGLLGQRQAVVDTGYMDVSPGLMLLGVVLAILAGAASRVLLPSGTRAWTGAVAGMVLVATIVLGYAVLTILYFQGPALAPGETWVMFLLQAGFATGVALLAGSLLGVLGWVVADRLARRPGWPGRRHQPRTT